MSQRVVIGALADGNYGLRISKAGFDANANPPVPANLIFDSQWPQLLPILQSGVVTSGSNSTITVTIPKLGYIPLFSVMIKAPGGQWVLGSQISSEPYYPPNGGTPTSYLQIWLVDGGIGIQNFTSGSDPSWPSFYSVAYIVYKVAG